MSAAQSFAPYVAVATNSVDADQHNQHKAALLLHTMPVTDRDWLLARLPAEQRDDLQHLLAELVQLGIPADRSLLDEVIGAAEAAGSVPASAPSLQTLARLDAAIIADVLREEPAVLLAHLLLMHHWPWRVAVLDAVGALKRRQVENHLLLLQKRRSDAAIDVQPPGMSALHQQLLETLQAHLETCVPGWRTGAKKADTELDKPAQATRWLRSLKTVLRRSGRS